MPKDCIGSYRPEGECLVCALSFICIDTTIAVDAWWDERCRERDDAIRWLEDHYDDESLRRMVSAREEV